MKVYLNGNFVDASEARVSVFDHGLLYGDGVFEGIRLYDGCVFMLEEHLERLEYSARAILLEMPWSRAEIAEAVCESCRKNGLKNGYIRLIVTRGEGSLGLSPRSCKQPQLIIIADTISLYPREYYEQGLKVITVPTRRVAPASLPPLIKSLNYLNNVLAKMEAQQHGYDEAFMLNEQGYISECTGDNVFIAHKGVIYTPSASDGALKGITRGAILELAEEVVKLPVREVDLTRYDVWNSDECFLTGTAAEIVPVVEADGRQISKGAPGAITQRFMEAFSEIVSKRGTHL